MFQINNVKNSSDYDVVIFDMDGIIFDSERAFMGCWVEIAGKYNISGIERVYLECTGATMERVKEIMLEAYGSDFDYESFSAEAVEIFLDRYKGGKMPIKKGVFELLEYLKKEGKKIALASSSYKPLVTQYLTDANLIGFFDEIVCGDMVSRSKPFPDIFLMACEKVSVEPDMAFAVEDSFNGISAAYAGGLRALMVPDLRQPNEDIRSKSEAVLESLNDVVDYLEALKKQ